jgi:hypothetical protein
MHAVYYRGTYDIAQCTYCTLKILTRGGSFKDFELSQLSLAERAKVKLTKVWFGLSRLSWTHS